MNGFTSDLGMVSRPSAALAPRCEQCKLYRRCISPKMPVSGNGERKILIIGESPGVKEDEQNRSFVGKTGQYLRDTLRSMGVELRRDCWLTNALICHPKNDKITDKRAIEFCRPNVIKAIKELKPEVIILLGGTAVLSVLGWLWKEDTGGISRWAGFQIPCQRLNTWICPAWHPSFVTRSMDEGKGEGATTMIWRKHLGAAVSLPSRPFTEIPDYLSKVKTIINPDEAADAIRNLTVKGRPLAFDYETDRLKPDHPEAEIVCCAISDGDTSIAYPWHGDAITATKEMIVSDVPKYLYNQRFETRWTRRILKTRINNSVWDGMLAAHVLDNRPRTKSLKFQAFALLGQEDYDSSIKPYLRSQDGAGDNAPNRIREAPLPDLLRYCGMDALLEWHVAKHQMQLMKMPNGLEST